MNSQVKQYINVIINLENEINEFQCNSILHFLATHDLNAENHLTNALNEKKKLLQEYRGLLQQELVVSLNNP